MQLIREVTHKSVYLTSDFNQIVTIVKHKMDKIKSVTITYLFNILYAVFVLSASSLGFSYPHIVDK